MSINCNNISVLSDAFLFVANEWICDLFTVGSNLFWGEEINEETKETPYDTPALVLNAIWLVHFLTNVNFEIIKK